VFGFGKKALFKTMEGYVNLIQFAIFHAAVEQTSKAESMEQRQRVAAACANLLVGKQGAAHTVDELDLARKLAESLVRDKEDLYYAAVMCLRTIGLIRGGDTVVTVVATLDWRDTFGALPSQAPNPAIMRKLAYDVPMKYCPDAVRVD
jgi:hypothetical protein